MKTRNSVKNIAGIRKNQPTLMDGRLDRIVSRGSSCSRPQAGQFFLPARDFLYFSLSQLAMNALAASPMVERV